MSISKDGAYYAQLADRMKLGTAPIPIHGDSDGSVYHPLADEEFRQCWDPNDEYMRDVPVYWFISNKEHLVSFSGEKMMMLRGCRQKTGYTCYRHNKKMFYAHVMAAKVFGYSAFGKAEELIREKGRAAYGNSKDSDNVQIHEYKDREGNLCYEAVTARIHKSVLHGAPGADATVEEDVAYMSKMKERLEEEGVTVPTIVDPGRSISQLTQEGIENITAELNKMVWTSVPEGTTLDDLPEILRQMNIK